MTTTTTMNKNQQKEKRKQTETICKNETDVDEGGSRDKEDAEDDEGDVVCAELAL